jgi:hypothetical protein
MAPASIFLGLKLTMHVIKTQIREIVPLCYVHYVTRLKLNCRVLPFYISFRLSVTKVYYSLANISFVSSTPNSRNLRSSFYLLDQHFLSFINYRCRKSRFDKAILLTEHNYGMFILCQFLEAFLLELSNLRLHHNVLR